MIQRIDSLAEALRDDWQRLYREARVSNLFLTHEWLSTWLAHMADAFVVLASRPLAGAPLDAAMMFRTEVAGVWRWNAEHSYRPGVLHLPGQTVPMRPFLLHVMTRELGVRRLVLDRHVDDEGARAELSRALGLLGVLAVPGEALESRFIATGGSFERYLAARPSKVRQELKRKEKAMARDLPGLELTELPASAGGAGCLALIEQVEEDSWKAAAGTAIITRERERRFYAAVFELGSLRTRARMFTLGSPASPVAFVLGVQHDDTFYALKTSYREDHARYSPGQVLFFRLIERFCEREHGVASIELLGKDSRWKKELATGARHLRRIELLRPDPLGLAEAVARGPMMPARVFELVKRVRARFRRTGPQ